MNPERVPYRLLPIHRAAKGPLGSARSPRKSLRNPVGVLQFAQTSSQGRPPKRPTLGYVIQPLRGWAEAARQLVCNNEGVALGWVNRGLSAQRVGPVVAHKRDAHTIRGLPGRQQAITSENPKRKRDARASGQYVSYVAGCLSASAVRGSHTHGQNARSARRTHLVVSLFHLLFDQLASVSRSERIPHGDID